MGTKIAVGFAITLQTNGNFSVYKVLLVSSIRCEAPGGGGTPLYKPYRNVPPQRHIPIHFVHFGLESGWVFEGTTEVFLSFQFQMSKKEREICEFEMDLNNFWVCVANLIMIT